MRKAKMMFISLLAVFAVGAVASASASAAPLWLVAKSGTFGTEAISGSAETITGGKLEGDSIAITCPRLSLLRGLIKEGTTGMASAVAFNGCKELNEEASCTLSSETISTNPGTASIANATEIEATPEGTTEFTTIKINNQTGKTCNLKGKYIITGSVKLTLGSASSELTEHEETFNSNSKIEINNNAATLKGSAKEALASGKTWSIMP
jgi:hypothetical protein